MTERTAIIRDVGNYFAAKGGTMTLAEYKEADDAPVRVVLIKRAIGSWARLLNMVGDLSQYDGTLKEEVELTPEDQTPEEPEPEPEIPLKEVVRAKKPN